MAFDINKEQQLALLNVDVSNANVSQIYFILYLLMHVVFNNQNQIEYLLSATA